jgi:hypothetical protein
MSRRWTAASTCASPPAPALRGKPPARQAHQDGVRRRLPAGGHGHLVLTGTTSTVRAASA